MPQLNKYIYTPKPVEDMEKLDVFSEEERIDFGKWLMLRLIKIALIEAKGKALNKKLLKRKYQAQQWLADKGEDYAVITFQECCECLNINKKLILKANNLLAIRE